MIKTYVLDTNVLLSDPTSIFSFEEHDVVLPMVILEELDHQKKRQDEVGRNARTVSRTLDDLRQVGSLLTGIKLAEHGASGNLRIATIQTNDLSNLPLELQSMSAAKVDNMIIAYMLALHNPNAILVSNDINVRLKCDSLGVKCEDYRKMKVASDSTEFYGGVTTIEVEEESVDQFYHEGKLQLDKAILTTNKLYPNQIVVLKNIKDGETTKSAIAKCITPDKPLVKLAKLENAFKLTPRNKEQSFALDLLFDDSIKLVTLIGSAGCVSPETMVTVKLSKHNWTLPEPVDTVEQYEYNKNNC